MANYKIKQIAVYGFVCIVLIWLLRLGTEGNDDRDFIRVLPPLELGAVKPKTPWSAVDLRDRLLVFVPEKKVPSSDQLAEAARAAELARQQAARAPVVDKTVKPMFSKLDEEHQIGLLAVIQSTQGRYTVLQKINFASKQSESIKLNEFESFDGWTVAIESQIRVVLSKSDRQIHLNLFKPGNI